MMTVISKLKALVIGAGVLALTILTIGGYARYQRQRADKAERIAEEVNQMREAVGKHRKRTNEARKRNNEQRLERDEQKHERTFFDNLD